MAIRAPDGANKQQKEPQTKLTIWYIAGTTTAGTTAGATTSAASGFTLTAL